MRVRLSIMFLATLSAGSLFGQAWDERVPMTSFPGTMTGHTMTHHEGTANSYLFGGLDGAVPPNAYDDTWRWDGCTWTLVNTETSPPARIGQTATFDSDRNVTFMFGGGAGAAASTDVWEFNASNWVQQTPTGGPSARVFAACAYDSNYQRVVVHGGLAANSTLLDDTWLYDGTQPPSSRWSQVTVSGAKPLPRHKHAMAYGALYEGVLLFGGSSPGAVTPFHNDLWEFRPIEPPYWYLVHGGGPSAPPAREGAALAYDAGKGVYVMTKGSDSSTSFEDVWEWDGTTWTNVTPAAPAPSQRGSSVRSDAHTLIYDANRDELVEVGRAWGTNAAQVWTRPGDNALKAVACQLGAGATGSTRVGTDQCPVASSTITIEFANLPVGDGYIYGAVSTTPRPSHDRLVGALHISPEVTLTPVFYSGDVTPTQSFAVPSTIGTSYYYQALVVPTGGSGVYTNSIELRVGL